MDGLTKVGAAPIGGVTESADGHLFGSAPWLVPRTEKGPVSWVYDAMVA